MDNDTYAVAMDVLHKLLTKTQISEVSVLTGYSEEQLASLRTSVEETLTSESLHYAVTRQTNAGFERIVSVLKLFPNWTISQVADELGVTTGSIMKTLMENRITFKDLKIEVERRLVLDLINQSNARITIDEIHKLTGVSNTEIKLVLQQNGISLVKGSPSYNPKSYQLKEYFLNNPSSSLKAMAIMFDMTEAKVRRTLVQEKVDYQAVKLRYECGLIKKAIEEHNLGIVDSMELARLTGVPANRCEKLLELYFPEHAIFR